MDKWTFEWDQGKNEANIVKHGVSFFEAQRVFLDPKRIIGKMLSIQELKRVTIALIDDAIMTVRFTYRNQKIRIFGAGFWRKGRKIYEEAQN